MNWVEQITGCKPIEGMDFKPGNPVFDKMEEAMHCWPPIDAQDIQKMLSNAVIEGDEEEEDGCYQRDGLHLEQYSSLFFDFDTTRIPLGGSSYQFCTMTNNGGSDFLIAYHAEEKDDDVDSGHLLLSDFSIHDGADAKLIIGKLREEALTKQIAQVVKSFNGMPPEEIISTILNVPSKCGNEIASRYESYKESVRLEAIASALPAEEGAKLISRMRM